MPTRDTKQGRPPVDLRPPRARGHGGGLERGAMASSSSAGRNILLAASHHQARTPARRPPASSSAGTRRRPRARGHGVFLECGQKHPPRRLAPPNEDARPTTSGILERGDTAAASSAGGHGGFLECGSWRLPRARPFSGDVRPRRGSRCRRLVWPPHGGGGGGHARSRRAPKSSRRCRIAAVVLVDAIPPKLGLLYHRQQRPVGVPAIAARHIWLACSSRASPLLWCSIPAGNGHGCRRLSSRQHPSYFSLPDVA